jgi:membrane protease subunit HflK
MKLHLPAIRWPSIGNALRGMFNLNDSRWGRGDDKPADVGGTGEPNRPELPAPEAQPPRSPERPQQRHRGVR